MIEQDLIFNSNILNRLNSMGIITRDNMADYIKLAKQLYKPNTKEFKRTIRPDFKTKEEQKAWEYEEIRKCIYGTKYVTGKMYFYLNYCTIKTMKGYDLPEYRQSDAAWFELITESTRQYDGCLIGRPLLALKRRRSGYSTKAASDSIHDSLFFPASETGLVSKSDREGENLLKKVKEVWSGLPEFLKHPLDGVNTRSFMEFVREIETKDGKEYIGNKSTINSVAPIPTAFEGRLLTKFIFDEIGKAANGVELFNMTYDCLTDRGKLVGQICCFGTAGNIDKEGKALLEFWNKHDDEAFKFFRFFVPAWTGISVDRFGNDIDIEIIVQEIITKREAMEKQGGRNYFDYLQKHPLTPKEALLSNKASGVGNIANINKQLDALNDTPVNGTRGRFKWDDKNSELVTFIPDSFGNSIVYERPLDGVLYASGIDTVDHDNTNKNASSQAMYIICPVIRTRPPQIVYEYVDKTDKVEEYYEQALMAAIYFNKCTPLVESNRFGFIKYWELAGFQHLLKKEPTPKNTIKRNYTAKIGIRKSTLTEPSLIRNIEDYTEEFCDLIPSRELLGELLDYGSKNTDRAVAFGWTLVSLEDDVWMRREQTERKEKKLKFRSMSFKKVNGVIKRNRE